MDEEKKELLEKIEKKVIPFAQSYLEEHDFKDYNVKDVFCYKKQIELVNKETKQKEKFKLYAVQTENPNPEKGKEALFELECLEDENGNIYTISDLIKEYEGFESIKDVVDKTNENEERPEEEQEEEYKKDTYEELKSERDKQEKDKKDSKEDEKVTDLKISNAKGEVDLDQQINGETLRKILGLSQDYISIVPVRTSEVGVKGSSEYCYVAKRADNTVTVLGEDVLKEDRQEGTNPYDKDTQINSDGSVSEKSSISGFRVANRPNFFITVGFDENSSTRESTITDVSGRDGRDEEVGHELEKEGDGWQDPDARNVLRKEDGIGEAEEIKERQEAHKEAGCENDRVENIDDDLSNNTHEHIKATDFVPGKKEVTFEQWANELGESTEELIARYEREFNKTANLEDIVDEIEADYDMYKSPEHRR